MVLIGPRPKPVESKIIEAFAQVSPSTIGHMTDTGFMKGLHALSARKLVGRAVTVKIPHLSSSAVHIAVSELGPYDVLVVDMNGDTDRASVGGMVAFAVHCRGAAGIVVDGSITDLGEIRELDMPVYYRGISALTTRNLGIEGAIHVPVSIGGAVVLPGDLILGDENGVMVLHGPEMEMARSAREKELRESETRRRLLAGEPLMHISGAERYVAAERGVRT